MSTASTCTKFHAHAWKKDLCVNCLKSKNVHTTTATNCNSIPSGTKRPAKPTGGKPVAAFRADVIRTSNRDRVENGLEERSSKPSIAAKPSRLKTQGSNEDEESVVEKSVEKSQTGSQGEREGTSTRTSDGGRRRSGTGTKSGRSSKRPMSPPPQAPNQPPPPPPGSAPANGTGADGSTVDGATVAEIMQQAVASAANNSQEKHYYHKYDVTGKSSSGQGQPASFVPPKNLLIEKFKLTHDTAPPFSASYKVDEVMSQPIAMPYTIVDVSTCPPSDAAPPKLPSSPAPERELGGGSSTTSSRTSSHSSSSLSSASMLLDDSGSPLTGRRHSGSPARSHSTSVSPQVRHRAMREVSPLAEEGSTKMAVVLQGDSERDKQFRSPTPPRKVPVFIQNNGRPSHTYEPIDQDDNLHNDNGNMSASTRSASSTDNANEEFVRQGNGRQSGAKSAAFEAKMAALSVLNLGKQSVVSTDNVNSTATADPQPSPPVKIPPIENIELPIQTPPGKRKQKPAATSQASKNKEPVDAKTDKNKKSKPGFFRRFLRFGSKEPEEGGSEDNGVDVSIAPESPAISEEPDISPPAPPTNAKDTDRQSSIEQSAMLVDIRSVLAKRKSSTPGLDGIDLKLSVPTEPVVSSAERRISLDKSVDRSTGQHSARGKDRGGKAGLSDDRKEQENKYKALPVDLKTELLQKGIQSLKQSPKPQRKLGASAVTTGSVIETNSPVRKPGKSKKPTVGPPSAPAPLSPPLPPPPPPPSGPPLATPPVTQSGHAPPLPQGPLPPPPPPGSPPPSTSRKPPKPTKKVSLKTLDTREGPGDPTNCGPASAPPSKLSVIISDNIAAVRKVSTLGTEDDGLTGKALHVDTGLLPESPHSPRSGDLSPLSDTSGDGDSRPSRARSKPDRNSKMVRSMMGAPPPPPDGGNRKSGQDTNSPTSPSASSLPSSPTRCIEISAPVAIGNASQTLPRNSYRREHSLGSAEDCSRYKKAVQGDSAAKHARNKTVTEGVKIDLQDITMRDRGMTDEECLAELTDNRASKFLNRALPAPPVGQEAGRSKKRGESQRDSEEHDGDNIYELVPSERGSQIDRGTYEDIDDDDLDASGEGGGLFQEFLHDVEVMFKSSSSQDQELSQLTSGEHPGKTAPDPPSKLFPHSASSDYLEPVTRGNDAEGGDDKGRVGKSKPGKHWRPTPSPRSSNCKIGSIPNFSEPYVFMYANTDILLDRNRPALSIPEAMAKVAMLNIETLQEVTDRVLDRVMTGDGTWQEGPRWKDYSLPDTNPHLTQGYTCFYRTRTAKRKPYDGYLMISPRSVPRELCSCQHLHLLRPALMFSDRISAEYFPEPPEGTEVDHYQFYGMVQTNIAIFDYTSVQSLESYLKELVLADNSKMKDYDRNVCYILSQIFSGVLYSRVQESPCVVNTLRPRDVLVVTSGEQEEKYVVVNNVCQGPAGGETIGTLCQDLIGVIFYLLNLQQPRDAELDGCQSRLPNRSTFSRGLQKVVQVLGAATYESLVTAWNMLQFMLWGPDEGALKAMNTAEQKAHAFSMWLEVERSKAVSKVALEGSDLDIKTVNMFRYLYSCNGTVLFETSQLLSS